MNERLFGFAYPGVPQDRRKPPPFSRELATNHGLCYEARRMKGELTNEVVRCSPRTEPSTQDEMPVCEPE